MSHHTSNADQRERWNDEAWTSAWPKREQLTDAVTASLLERLALRGDERVLDVGSGAGGATIAVARALTAGGSVVGADVSEALVAYATARAADAGSTNVRFCVADAQADDLAGAPFSLAMSQFGVMFFSDPVAAFANVRRQLEPGAPFVAICWREAALNPWFLGGPLAALLPEPPPLAPGAHPTGPFAFADGPAACGLLAAAGFADAACEAVDSTAVLDRGLITDGSQARFVGVADERMDEALAILERYASGYEGVDGSLEFPIAYWVLRARA